MDEGADGVFVVLLKGGSDVARPWRDEGLYLLKDIFDHFMDIFSRHSLGILDGLKDVVASSLDVIG